MSWRHIEAVGPLDLRPPVKHVLFVLAHHTNDHTGFAFPGLERIAQWTGLNRRTIQLAIKELETLGYLSVRRGGWREGRNVASLYTLTLPDVQPIQIADTIPPEARGESHTPPPAQGGESQDRGGESHDNKGAVGIHPNSDSKGKNASDARAFDDDWKPKDETIERIKRDEKLSDQVIERERRSFILTCLAGDIPRHPDPAFRKWCSRLKGLRHPLPEPARLPASSAEAQTPIATTDDADARIPVIRHELKERLGERTYEGWLGSNNTAFRVKHSHNGTALLVLSKSKFMADWILNNLVAPIDNAAKRQGIGPVVVEVYEQEAAAA